jgi:hypothetical protein
MRGAAFPSSLVAIAAFLVTAPIVEGAPFLPDEIAVGAEVTGWFSFPISPSPVDADSSPIVGRYTVDSSSAQMAITVGGTVFSSTSGGFVVHVTDQPYDADWIQLQATGNESTFSPYLSGFLRQNSRFDPLGSFGLNFRFSPTQFSDDRFPVSIDPLATVPYPSWPGSIFGGVGGVSVQRSNRYSIEWSFGYAVDPLALSIMLNAGVLSGNFTGTIYHVDDRALVYVPAPIPEPSSFLLLLSGLFAFRTFVKTS